MTPAVARATMLPDKMEACGRGGKMSFEPSGLAGDL